MTRPGALLLGSLSVGLWLSCGAGGDATSPPSQAVLLGAEPIPAALDAGSVDGGWPADSFGIALTGLASMSPSVQCESGPCPVREVESRPGSAVGVLAVIVDDSGSNTATASTCTGCPTDPDNLRKQASVALFKRLLSRAPGWRVALFDFGYYANAGLTSARLLAGYTSVATDLEVGAEQIEAAGSTYIFNSLVDVAPTVAGEGLSASPDTVPLHIVLLTDGEDTSSSARIDLAIAQAQSLGVRVTCIGYGGRSDGGTILLADKAWRDLRRIAAETGGFSTFVSADELPGLFNSIADSLVDGSTYVRVAMPGTGPSVRGAVTLGTDSIPFSFTDVP